VSHPVPRAFELVLELFADGHLKAVARGGKRFERARCNGTPR
jgi:hypothetical protein